MVRSIDSQTQHVLLEIILKIFVFGIMVMYVDELVNMNSIASLHLNIIISLKVLKKDKYIQYILYYIINWK